MKIEDNEDRVTPFNRTDSKAKSTVDKGADRPNLGDRIKNRFSGMPNRRRGIYLLPNIITTGALFAGFYAIVAAMNGEFVQASFSIFVAAALDTADGRVARLTNTESEFGREYDSLSDMVAFGVAPSLVAFSWGLSTLGQVGWVVTFVYMACAALRLARFNTKEESENFVGLASPAAACLVGCCIWVWSEYVGGELSTVSSSIVAVVLLLTGLLMVSNFLYYSPKQVKLKDRVPFVGLVVVIFTFSIILLDPPLVLLFIGVAYALSGPLTYLWRKSVLTQEG